MKRVNASGPVEASHYVQRGVSTSKPDVKYAIQGVDPGLFPNAFCKAVPDYFFGSPEHCVLAHADGAGTKSALAYISYRRHGDPNVFKGIAQDCLVMNIDDLLCAGATGPYVFSNTIGRNIKRIPGQVIKALVQGYEDFSDKLRDYGIEIVSCGGETADLGDLVRTLIVDSSVVVRMKRSEFVDCSSVKPGHVIVGLSSAGRATYESIENSGVGTNGFTALRHGLFSSRYRMEFEETFAPEIREVAYMGRYDIDDPLPGTGMTIGEACLSPTRTYAPIIHKVLEAYRPAISAMFHNTGGGQTKCLHFGQDVRYVKDNLLPLPALFEFVRREVGMQLGEMLQVFNMGHRFEIVCEECVSDKVIAVARSFGVESQVIGFVERAPGRTLSICFEDEIFEFKGT